MARPPFADIVRDAQQRGKIILLDGPMGTELQRSGLDLENELSHRWNLSHSSAIEVVYEDYVNAGAEALLTNTFSAHLGDMKGETDWQAAVQTGIDLARLPEWDHLYAIGSVGTAVGKEDQALPAILAVMQSLASCDAILVETQNRLDRMRELMTELHTSPPTAPLILSFSFSRLPRQDNCWLVETINGEERTAEDIGRWANDHSEDLLALGANCGTNLRLEDFVKIARDYRSQTDLPLLIKPGITPTIECEFTPKEYAAQVKAFADAGVTLLGGCCGTTPAHIAALRKEIDRLELGWQ
jgi:5-methyltetrahydrofolate--homocysteine methyltransferase